MKRIFLKLTRFWHFLTQNASKKEKAALKMLLFFCSTENGVMSNFTMDEVRILYRIANHTIYIPLAYPIKVF